VVLNAAALTYPLTKEPVEFTTAPLLFKVVELATNTVPTECVAAFTVVANTPKLLATVAAPAVTVLVATMLAVDTVVEFTVAFTEELPSANSVVFANTPFDVALIVDSVICVLLAAKAVFTTMPFLTTKSLSATDHSPLWIFVYL
jgi:hypothetical protein